MGDCCARIIAFLFLALIGYQLYYNTRCLLDMGSTYLTLNNALYYIGALMPGFSLALYSVRLTSKIADKTTSNEDFAKIWANICTYATIARIYFYLSILGLLPYVFIRITLPEELSTQHFALYMYYWIAVLQCGPSVVLSVLFLGYYNKIKKQFMITLPQHQEQYQHKFPQTVDGSYVSDLSSFLKSQEHDNMGQM